MKYGKWRYGLSVILLWCTASCEQEDIGKPVVRPDLIMDISADPSRESELLREVSQLVGKVLSHGAVRREVDLKIGMADPHDELASIAFLLDRDYGVNKREQSALESGKLIPSGKENLFRAALLQEVDTNPEQYVNLSGLLDQNGYTLAHSKSEKGSAEALIGLLAGEHLEIYHPYEKRGSAAKELQRFYVSYRPEEYRESGEAFQLFPGNTHIEPFGLVDNSFIELNDVYIIGRMDDCDRPLATCEFVDLDPGSRGIDPDPIGADPKLLTYNVNHESIGEEDIISSRFSGFRVNGKDWLGFGATHQKLIIYRGSADGKITLDDGKIKASSNSYKVGFFRIRAKGARKGWWFHHNEEFDDDWNMSESEQAISVFTKHHLSGSASVELKTKAGLKLDGGKIKPVAEATVNSKVKITVGSARQRSRSQLSRRQVLSSIVGPGVTGATISREGVNWNVKKSGIFQYYLRHYHTDL